MNDLSQKTIQDLFFRQMRNLTIASIRRTCTWPTSVQLRQAAHSA